MPHLVVTVSDPTWWTVLNKWPGRDDHHQGRQGGALDDGERLRSHGTPPKRGDRRLAGLLTAATLERKRDPRSDLAIGRWHRDGSEKDEELAECSHRSPALQAEPALAGRRSDVLCLADDGASHGLRATGTMLRERDRDGAGVKMLEGQHPQRCDDADRSTLQAAKAASEAGGWKMRNPGLEICVEVSENDADSEALVSG